MPPPIVPPIILPIRDTVLGRHEGVEEVDEGQIWRLSSDPPRYGLSPVAIVR